MSNANTDQLNGLPAPLPPGETIIWQGRPVVGRLLNDAFHARAVGIYFLILGGVGFLMGSPTGALLTLASGALCIGVLALLARASARTSVYTLTERRLVLRVGMALPMHFNLPLKQIAGADLRKGPGTSGDIALHLSGRGRIAWALLWPHVRPWRLRQPEPMLRGLADAELVAGLLHRCCAALVEADDDAKTAAVASARTPKRRPTRVTSQPAGVAA